MTPTLIWTTKTIFDGFKKAHQTMQRNTEIGMRKAIEHVRSYAQNSKLSGQVLNVRTNNLRGGVRSDIEMLGGVIVGTVGTNVIYGRFWEKGEVPGQAARPWLEPAFEECKARIMEILGNTIKVEIIVG